MDVDDSFIAQDSACLTPRSDDLSNSLLNFNTTPDELDLQCAKRQKTSRDPMSHRIIEKRRRDRMNNCLADLSRLIPTSYLKQGQGRIEKTEIIEMAIKHIKTLQAQVDSQCQNYDAAKNVQDEGSRADTSKPGPGACCRERFYQGFRECQDETLRYFVEGEAMVASDPFCVRVMEHLTTVSHHLFQPYAADDKQEVQMDLEAQQMMGSSASFRSSSPLSHSSRDSSMLPLPPMGGRMMVPSSPVADKNLRNLLTKRALQQLEAQREAAATGPQNKAPASIATGTNSLLPAATVTAPRSSVSATGSTVSANTMDSGLGSRDNSDNSVNEGVSSGYVSDMLAMDQLSNGTSPGDVMLGAKDSSAINIYKFKHNITKRFSQEGKVLPQQYDGGSSSTSSREAEEERHHVKYRSVKNKCRHPSSSDSGPYPTSERSGATSTSSHDSVEGGHERKCRKLASRSQGSIERAAKAECCARSSVPLPGFVLHPSGTHYVPMSVCHSNLPDIFDSVGEAGVGAPVFHPISIPVHFKGPVISVPGASVSTVTAPCSAAKTLDPAAAQHKDSKGAKKGPQ